MHLTLIDSVDFSIIQFPATYNIQNLSMSYKPLKASRIQMMNARSSHQRI
ncbi:MULTISPECIES: hypothetical protein [unclassified Enterococcus]|nr:MULTISPECIES: hypothetical protein [unclassified Enterococcus]